MQACFENAAPALLDSVSLPLLESAPAWTIRVARREAADRDELAQELHGVPKAALRQVFGKLLGTRLWQQHRAGNCATATIALTGPSSATAPISNGELSAGMLRYLCTEAAITLNERKRFAKSISLTVLYSNGESETVRESLPYAVNEATALEATARVALSRMRSEVFVSLQLDLTAAAAQA